MSKTLADTFLFRKYGEYEKNLIDAIMKGEVIDKKVDGFDDIIYDVKKRQISTAVIKVLSSDNVILLTPPNPLPKSLKVFVAKDIKSDRKLKVFIDCTGLITKTDKGNYICTNIDMLISHLVNAMNSLIYYADEKRIVMNNTIIQSGADAFSKLFTFVVDHLFKISSVPSIKNKCVYLTAMYYMVNLLGKDDDNESIRSIAKKLSGISDREEDIIKYQLDKNSFLNIKYFVETLSDVLKFDKLTLDVVVEKWMYLYGTGTVFALELYPNFAAMLTDTYVGCYINNQKTIEKVTGDSMVIFSKGVLDIGADSL